MQTIHEIKEEKIDPAVSTIKQKLGDARRRVKQIDLRQNIVDNPLPAVGIGIAAGALIGLIRPMPKRNPITGALMGLVTGLAYRAVRSYGMAYLATYAKEFIQNAGNEKSVESSTTAYKAPF